MAAPKESIAKVVEAHKLATEMLSVTGLKPSDRINLQTIQSALLVAQKEMSK